MFHVCNLVNDLTSLVYAHGQQRSKAPQNIYISTKGSQDA